MNQLMDTIGIFNKCKARIFLLIDLLENICSFRTRGMENKSSENDQLTGYFQSFFLISPEQTVKLIR